MIDHVTTMVLEELEALGCRVSRDGDRLVIERPQARVSASRLAKALAAARERKRQIMDALFCRTCGAEVRSPELRATLATFANGLCPESGVQCPFRG